MLNLATVNLTLGTQTRPFHYRPQTSDEKVAQMVFSQRQYDLTRLARVNELLAFVRHKEALGLRPLIVDAGANIGAASIYFHGNFPNALVVAVEPEVSNFQVLMSNIQGLPVEPLRAAVASSMGQARLVDAGIGHWGFRTTRVAPSEDPLNAVACVTINQIYADHCAGYFPFLVKIDIEGGEGELFSANTEWVERTPLIIVELHDWLIPKARTSASFLQCVSRLRRDFVFLGEDVYSIANDLEDQTAGVDRKSTRLNSSHLGISYAVFCLKKKKQSKE